MGRNFIILSRFVDRDMLMRYHWGLGIGHSYSHMAVSPDSRSCSTLRQPCSGRDGTEDYRFCTDEGEDLNVTGMQIEQDSEFEFEPEDYEPSIESQSDVESSILGDNVDMYGPHGLDALDEYFEF